ncbi:hypothetical protein CNEO3_1250013 [Clostridium neonatale]|nr:hypothetical protein CNEO3_1250013 [Clostridium neonatale]
MTLSHFTSPPIVYNISHIQTLFNVPQKSIVILKGMYSAIIRL